MTVGSGGAAAGGTASAPSGAADTKTTNLVEAAEAITGHQQVDAAPELLNRLKDKGLVHTAGFIDGKWTSGAIKGSTFQVWRAGMASSTRTRTCACGVGG
jgi:hypothetical protein